MIDSENGTTCMWVRQVIESTTICEKQFHACNNSDVETKTKTVLEQASMCQKVRKHSLKSSRQNSYETKHKKHKKCNTRHGKRAYPKTTELNVLTSPRCDVECQHFKVDVRNELCTIQLMSFDNIEVVMCMPQI